MILLIIFILTLSNPLKAEVEILDFSDLDLDDQVDTDDSQSRENESVVKNLKVEEILEPSGDYQFSSANKKDPFEPSDLKQIREQRLSATSQYIEVENPLQAYPLDQLKVKGMWILPDGQPRAMIMTPKKEGFIIKVGDLVAAGKVLSINKEKVVIRQYHLSVKGSREFEDSVLTIGLKKNDNKNHILLKPGGVRIFVNNNQKNLKSKHENTRENEDKMNPADTIAKISNKEPLTDPSKGNMKEVDIESDTNKTKNK